MCFGSLQLRKLQVSIDQAETERQELEEEVRRERHACQELQLIISQLQQHINPSTNHNPDLSTTPITVHQASAPPMNVMKDIT